MRLSFRRQPGQPLNRSSARNCALINQLATPGLGSLMAGRLVAGIGQLLLAVAGFAMFMGWFALVLVQFYTQMSDASETKSIGWLGKTGGLAFAVAWLWSLVTSLSILREAREAEGLND